MLHRGGNSHDERANFTKNNNAIYFTCVLAIAITVGIYEIYLERKTDESIIGLMISFIIRCVIATFLSYYTYLEILNG